MFSRLWQKSKGEHTPASMYTYLATPAPDFTKAKWVKDLSNKLLMEAQYSLLARSPNFAVVPLYSLKGEYITAVEEACLILPHNGRGT